jgi:hypothetical protein
MISTTITIGSCTKAVSELPGDTPSAVYAYVGPTHDVEAKGVVTSAPGSGWDSFIATTFVIAPRSSAPIGGGQGTVVNVTRPCPKGISSSADTYPVGSQTKVLGNTYLAPGDSVAGGPIAPSGERATAVGSTPLQVLFDFAPQTSSTSSSAMTAEMTRRTERRALEMLRHEQARLGRYHEKFRIVKK